MSNVLKRIQKAKKNTTPGGVKNDVAEMYIEDIKKSERAAAHKEIMDDLIKAADSAELDTALARIEGMVKEVDAIKSSLSQSNERNKKLEQEIQELHTKNSVYILSENELKSGHSEQLKKLSDEIQELKVALAVSEAKPPATVQTKDPIPSMEFTPVRGPDGRTETVIMRPL